MCESRSGSKFSSMYCNTSSMPICFPLPVLHTELNGRPLITADSSMNTAVAPLPLMKSTPFSCSVGMGFVKTLWCHAFISPMQLGPMRAAPYFSHVASMRCSSSAPALVSSPNPAEIIMKALTPFSAASTSTLSGHIGAGITSTARSVGGSSCMSWNTLMPCTSSSLGLTILSVPL